MLTDRITLSTTADELEPEDYLSTSLGVIFPDDITNQHGDPSTPVIYTSPRFGKIFLNLADPVGEGSRKLFAQYLWNAGVYVAIELENAFVASEDAGYGGTDGIADGVISSGQEWTSDPATRENGRGSGKWKREKGAWDVRGETVLELGAGTGIAVVVAVKAGARETFITDYPAEEVLANLRGNVERNLGEVERKGCYVMGHAWGVVPGFKDAGEPQDSDLAVSVSSQETPGREAVSLEGVSSEGQNMVQVVDKDISVETDRKSFPASYAQYFTRVILADCLWMLSEHANLRHSIAHFLSPDGYAIVVAGFHSGRARMAPFFDAEALSAVGLEVESIVEKDAVGREREWRCKELGDMGEGREDLSERKRWLVVALLRKVRSKSEGDSSK